MDQDDFTSLILYSLTKLNKDIKKILYDNSQEALSTFITSLFKVLKLKINLKNVK